MCEVMVNVWVCSRYGKYPEARTRPYIDTFITLEVIRSKALTYSLATADVIL